MGVQTQADSEDDFYGTYEEILTEDELQQLENEFRPRLKNACYLDHSGATLYAKNQIDAFYSELQSSLFSNPHSRNPSSSITTDAIDYIRLRILHHFGTTGEDYSVIFTSGATSALKLVAESFRFNGGTFAYMEESHTSVVGMREVVGTIKPVDDQIKENKNIPVRGVPEVEGEKVASDSTPKVYCLAKATLEKLMDSKCGGCSACTRNRNSRPRYRYREGLGTLISYDQDEDQSQSQNPDQHQNKNKSKNQSQSQNQILEIQNQPNGLLVYPAQCNFSGYKYPLEWIAKVQENHLDEINQIDHFYIEPQHIVQLRKGRNNKARQDPSEGKLVEKSKVDKNKKIQLNTNTKEVQVQLELNSIHSSKLGSFEQKLLRDDSMDAHESTRIKNGYNGNDHGMTSESSAVDVEGRDNGWSMSSSIIQSLGSGMTADEVKSETSKEPTLSNNHQEDQDHEENEEEDEDEREREGNEEKSPFNWYVLLDAASYVATNALDLSLYPADFVVCSFYKMFGFPTGLGALIVRNEVSSLLEKRYFGGGTVNIAIPSQSFHAKRQRLHEKFEDGTISFLSILALGHGFDTLKTLGRSMDTISMRAFRLAQYCYKNLVHMKYPNGQPVVVIYSDTKYESRSTQGPIVTFNLLRPDGTIIGYSEMEQIAYLHDVHMRYGCFCNVGACRRHLKLDPVELLKHYEAGHVCGDMKDLIDGKPTGAIRVSFGYMTTQKDVDIILRLIHTCWVHPFQNISEANPVELLPNHGGVNKIEDDDNPWRPKGTPGASHLGKGSPRKLSRIFVYPVKSCAPFQVSKMWAIGNRGLLYDREWLIMNSSGVPLTLKREPRLCQLKPNIDISNRRLVLSMEGYPDVSVPLEIKQVGMGTKNEKTVTTDLCSSKVCGDTVAALDCGEEVNNWLSTVLNRPGLKLVRMPPDQMRKPRNALDGISLANFSQMLLLSMGSLRRLAKYLLDKKVDWDGLADLDRDLDLDISHIGLPIECPSDFSRIENYHDPNPNNGCGEQKQGGLASEEKQKEKEDGSWKINDERAQRTEGSSSYYGSDQNHDLLDQEQQLDRTRTRTRSRTRSHSTTKSKEKEQDERGQQVWRNADHDDTGILSNSTNGDTSSTPSVSVDVGIGIGVGVDIGVGKDRIRNWNFNSSNSPIGFTSKVHQKQKEHLQITKIVEELIERFRGNLVITDEKEDDGDGGDGCVSECFPLEPYEEESWDEIRIGKIPLKNGGACIRCATICTNPKTGQRSAEPFLTLSASRQGQANFGIHLYQNKNKNSNQNQNLKKEQVSHEMRQSALSNNVGNGHGIRDKTVSQCKNEREELEAFSLSASASPASISVSASIPSSLLALWTSFFSSSSSSSTSTLPSSSSPLACTPPVQIIRVGDLLYIDSMRPELQTETDTNTQTDSNGNEVEKKRGNVRVHQNHHHLSANAPHRNANGNPFATLENKKIIDSID